MKKKTLILGVIALLLGLMLVLTGCGEKTNDGTNSSNKKGNSREGLKVGDYVDYTYDKAEDYVLSGEKSGYTKYRTTTAVEQTVKQEDLRWQIFNIDEETGRVDLISSASGPEIYLNGLAAYNEGVTILNDICEKQYSNAELGIKARSINIEDIENKMNDSGIEKKTNQKFASVNYGDIKNITEAKYCYYPSIYEQEVNSGVNSEELKQDGIKASEIGTVEGESFKQANKLTVKKTSYWIDKGLSSYLDTQAYDVLCKNISSFWIASRGVGINDVYAMFELFVATNDALGTQKMYNSNKEEEWVAMKHGFRPIVSIDGNIKIEAKEGTIQNMHTITK